ncbi:hypothetical protein COY95_03935 [Candidatus Woesearchaeota archaeon CG_4_10_14_0_8_um_filter_47_5]|nr:MAG: hypothetical protein COY95_03935 [Candidatus Woesearchaeota archaeon CG_4_10_14_0_8_um_filter_47_5]
MDPPQVYIIISLVAFAIIAALLFFIKKSKKEKRLTPLAGAAFACLLAGIIFGEERLIGYSLIGIGVILSIIDIIQKR